MIEDFVDSKKCNDLKETVFYGSGGYLKRFGYDMIDFEDRGKAISQNKNLAIPKISGKIDREKYKEKLMKEIKSFISSVKDYFSEIDTKE